MSQETLEAAARPLYEGLPDDFVSSRKEIAAQLRKSGDAPLARRIQQLRKPSRAAWAVNLFVRAEPERVDALLALGEDLRRAQDEGAGDELRTLAAQRRELIGDAVTTVRALAGEAGTPLGDALVEQVSQTLQAALADPGAAAALESGLLVDTLMATGFDAVDLEGKVAVPEAVGAEPRPRLRSVTETPAKKAPAKKTQMKPAEDQGTARAREAAEVLARAEQELDVASQTAEAARGEADAARAVLDDLHQRRTKLNDELAEVEFALADARTVEASARKARTAAEREEKKARRATERARRAAPTMET